MTTREILLCVSVLAILSCRRVQLPKDEVSAPYLSVLEQGLTDECRMIFPRGDVQIMSQLSSQMERPDSSSLKFSSDYLNLLQLWEKDGLITLNERQQSSLESVGNMGARIFAVSPTEKLLKAQSVDKSDKKTVVVQTCTMKVVKILKKEGCHPPEAKSGDEFILVLGTMRGTPTAQVKALQLSGFDPKDEVYKFRARLQYNPFVKTYSFISADHGRPEDVGWLTNTVTCN